VSQQKTNLRVRRTQKLLREALIELIEEKGFDAITVIEITERAMVSRAAFYRNYQDKYDLVEKIFAEAMETLFDSIAEPVTEHPPQVWVRFFEHIAEYERLYHALLGRSGSSWFVMKMRAVLIDLLKQYQQQPLWQTVNGHVSDAFVLNLLATMLVEAIVWWLEEGRPYSTQEITTRCVSIASAIFKETSTWQ
jgi:AcrR family transcriptional regulator